MIARPKITNERAQELTAAALAGVSPSVVIVGLRGYFTDSVGRKGENDFNQFDDAILVIERGQIVGRFNANTDPSKIEGRAMLKPGLYSFYKGKHKGRIDALRAYPEGVVWQCWRTVNGKRVDSTCSAINIHDAGQYDTWSEGCQTIPGAKGGAWGDQFKEFRDLVYSLMTRYSLKYIHYLLIDVTGKM